MKFIPACNLASKNGNAPPPMVRPYVHPSVNPPLHKRAMWLLIISRPLKDPPPCQSCQTEDIFSPSPFIPFSSSCSFWASHCLSQKRELSFPMCGITNHSIANSLRAPSFTSASASAICVPCFCPVESCTFLKAVNIYSLSPWPSHARTMQIS